MAFEERPINADLPPVEAGQRADAKAQGAAPLPPPVPPPPRRRRKPVPAALKAIAGLFLLAVVFIVAAILGGRGESSAPSTETAAPVSQAPSARSEAPTSQTSEELGFPAFATANTTRVGGGDAASTAAGVALATYPSTEPSQQPAAVVLVDRGDWLGAVAASVLAASPIGAPILVSEAGGVPEPTAQALAALDPHGSHRTDGTQIFAIGAASVPPGFAAKRLSGSVVGAPEIAALRDRLFGEGPRHIVIAPAAHPSFAMPAAAWAALSGDPILYADEEKLPEPTAEELKRHPHTPVYVLGPSSTISSDVVRKIERIAGSVHRVSGEDPVANAIEFARYSEGGFGWNINDPGHGLVLADSAEPLDAAVSAPLSASGAWGPLLLTDSADTLPSALRGYLLDIKPGYTTDPTRAFYNHVWVIGDQESVSVDEQAEIDELAALAKIGGEG